MAWKRDGEVLDLTTGSYKTTNNGITAQLSISNIKRDLHQGTYICEVTSTVFGIRNKTFKITVEGLCFYFIHVLCLYSRFIVLKSMLTSFLDKTLKFPLGPMIAGLVVVACTIVLAITSRLDKIIKVCTLNSCSSTSTSISFCSGSWMGCYGTR